MLGISCYLAVPIVLIASAQSYFLKTTGYDVTLLKLPILVACAAVCWFTPGFVSRWFANKLGEFPARKRLKSIENATWMAIASGDVARNPRAALTSIMYPILEGSNVAAKAREALSADTTS